MNCICGNYKPRKVGLNVGMYDRREMTVCANCGRTPPDAVSAENVLPIKKQKGLTEPGMQNVSVMMDKNTVKAIEKIAQNKDKTLEEFIRDIVRQYVGEME